MPREFIKKRNCTLTPQEKNYLIENFQKKDCKTIAKELNVSYGRIVVHVAIFGLKREVPEPTFEKNGFFNVDEFCKLYKW